MARSHAALASVGVAAFARLVVATGPAMDAATWGEVLGTLRGVVDATLPDAAGLVTPPSRGGAASASGGASGAGGASAGGDVASPLARGTAVSGSSGVPFGGSGGGNGTGPGGSSGAGTPRPPYTLREGVGMRRLGRFRVHAGVQLLLVQTLGEVYARQHARLPVGSVTNVLVAWEGGMCQVGCLGRGHVPEGALLST
jgi:brefeldin A-inhibited guanine nucleotide-exchange protein